MRFLAGVCAATALHLFLRYHRHGRRWWDRAWLVLLSAGDGPEYRIRWKDKR